MAVQRREFCIGAAGAGLMLSARPAFAEDVVDYRQIVFADPKSPEMEAEFDRWYDTQHIPDMFNVPGMWRIRRLSVLRAATPSSTLPHHIALYDFRLRPSEVEPAMAVPTKRKADGLNPDTPTFNHDASRSIIFKAGPELKPGTSIPPKTGAAGAPLGHYAMVVMVNPTPSSPELDDKSYDQQHVLEVAGAAGMQRARLDYLYRPLTRNYDAPAALAVWEFDSGDIDATLADIAARRTGGAIKPVKRWAPDHVQVYYCRIDEVRMKAA